MGSIKSLSFLPQSVVIVGGGIIAVEFARIFSQLKAKVTMVVRSPCLAISLKRVGIAHTLALSLSLTLTLSLTPSSCEPSPAPGIDPELAAVLEADLLLEGVEILFESEVASGGLTAKEPSS